MTKKKKTAASSKKAKPKAPVSAITPKENSVVSRYISFAMLIVTILVFSFFFYNVIKGFLLPLFLAALLAVIFRPYHKWVNSRCSGRHRLAAALCTGTIMLLVLGPLTGLILLGLHEANQVLRSKNEYIAKVKSLGQSAGLHKPFADQLDQITAELKALEDSTTNFSGDDTPYYESLIKESKDRIVTQTKQLRKEGFLAASEFGDELLEKHELSNAAAYFADLEKAKAVMGDADGATAIQLGQLKKNLAAQVSITNSNTHDAAEDEEEEKEVNREPEKRAIGYALKQSKADPKNGFLELIQDFETKLEAVKIRADDHLTTSRERADALEEVRTEFRALRTSLLGGPIWESVTELANPSEQQIKEWVSQGTSSVRSWLPSITNTATSWIVGLLVGLSIMAVAMFYFFLDGAKMVNTFMHLSPLDDRHEMELLQEFDKVGRAVVLATLLSAVAQGILGGIGYKLVGLDSVFLLTLLTAVLALIPFVGAAAIWVPACLYLAFIKEPIDAEATRTWMFAKAGFLAVYGVLVVSMADNVIKPWVLQGQSKLHPLLALLSVLGGVQALGPIGILIGPMVVAFLQVLLTILQREISSMESDLSALQ